MGTGNPKVTKPLSTWSKVDINYALVETTRPPMYTAMKYWGKKPHNIWAEFVEHYCPPGGTVLDPFCGSAVAGFEAVKLGRKAICLDLNPLSSFLIKTMTLPFDPDKFLSSYNDIVDEIEADHVYQEHFYRKNEAGDFDLVYNYRWDFNNVVKLAIETSTNEKKLINATAQDKKLATKQTSLTIPYWYPTNEFPVSPSITHKFIKEVGGNSFEHLWTRRSIYILAKIFNAILKQDDSAIRDQLLFAFLQTLHLTSKMVVPRDSKSGRDFSGSWGRADYMIRRRSMEQNPLVVFWRSCADKQSALTALMDAKKRIPQGMKCAELSKAKKLKLTTDLNYGIADVADLSSYVAPKSIDFIITDPPYAGLVQYLDLSMVWLAWLQHVDKKFIPNLDAEITIKKGKIERSEYSRRLMNAFKQMHHALKDDGVLVVTFHHKKIQEWNEFVGAVRLAGFDIEKITHQYNRRSGEANVANPYGTSGADFYIRCTKNPHVDPSSNDSNLQQLILRSAISTIAQRSEKTPFTFIVPGIMPAVINAGFWAPSKYQAEIMRVLSAEEGPGKIFVKTPNHDNKAGDYWWFNDPSQHINYPDVPLVDRVEEVVLALLRRQVAVKLDDVLAEVFRCFPNGLTPDPKGIVKVLSKYAFKSADKWKLKISVLQDATAHTQIIQQVLEMGQKSGSVVYVGKREQPEACVDGSLLRDHADIHDLSFLSAEYEPERIARLEMIDAIWLLDEKVTCIFEVENSTNFMSAIQRGSNLPKELPKFMVIPDSRKAELLSKVDPLFQQSFSENNWRYILFSEIKRLKGFSMTNLAELKSTSKAIKK